MTFYVLLPNKSLKKAQRAYDWLRNKKCFILQPSLRTQLTRARTMTNLSVCVVLIHLLKKTPERVLKVWAGVDSNHRTLARTDLQSVAFSHSATYPYSIFNIFSNILKADAFILLSDALCLFGFKNALDET